MSQQVPSAPVASINLEFRPKSYFWPLPLATHAMARVKSVRRQAALREFLQESGPAPIPDWLTIEAVDEHQRDLLHGLGPTFASGEYLPDMLELEVEVARIILASTTQDVTSVYARRGRSRIYYRVVDEYEGETLSAKRTRSSTRPLSLGELESFFNAAWSIFDVLEMNFLPDDSRRSEKAIAFAAATSAFYPQFGSLYQARISEWVRHPGVPLSLPLSV